MTPQTKIIGSVKKGRRLVLKPTLRVRIGEFEKHKMITHLDGLDWDLIIFCILHGDMRSVEHLIGLMARQCGHSAAELNAWMELHGCKVT